MIILIYTYFIVTFHIQIYIFNLYLLKLSWIYNKKVYLSLTNQYITAKLFHYVDYVDFVTQKYVIQIESALKIINDCVQKKKQLNKHFALIEFYF